MVLAMVVMMKMRVELGKNCDNVRRLSVFSFSNIKQTGFLHCTDLNRRMTQILISSFRSLTFSKFQRSLFFPIT
ncbi:hypothetical protein RJT34_20043 [Clitoria ternatea]|uniref:Uncharacterized protein n=1 Tax=Clitoria ternatea TaxID=43366 RepID=A0AAN9IS44_CLITE